MKKTAYIKQKTQHILSIYFKAHSTNIPTQCSMVIKHTNTKLITDKGNL